MRILQVTDSFSPAVGGVERYVEALGNRLSALGHTVGVCTSAARGSAAVELLGQVEVFRLPSLTGSLRPVPDGTVTYLPTFVDPVFAAKLWGVIDRWRPDVVHAHGWSLHSCLPAVRHHGVPLVASLHEYGLICPKKTLTRASGRTCREGMSASGCTKCGREQYGGLLKSAALSVPLALSRPDRWPISQFVANSPYVADAVSRHSLIDRSRITVVPPSTLSAADLGGPSPDEDRIDPQFDLPPRPFILYVGAMSRNKGIEVLLEARRMMRDPWPLVILGATRRHSFPRDDDAGVVVFADVPHRQVMWAWRRAGIGVVPSVWPEPFGQVAVECMAAGAPVVVSDTGGLGNLVEHGSTGLKVPPGEPVALAAALDRLAEDDSLRRRLGEAGRATCAELTVEATTAQMASIYESVLTEAGASVTSA